MRDERGHWYLVTGFVIGIVLGLVYAWLIAPQQRQDTSPASLQPEFKDQYRAMIASAFVATGNLPRAEARLALLGDDEVIQVLAAQAQRTLGEGKSPLEAQAIGLLAVALGEGGSDLIPSPLPSATPTEAQNTPISTQASGNPEPLETTSPATQTATGVSPSPEPTNQDPQETSPALSSATPLPTRTPTATPGAPFVLQSSTFVCDPDLPNPLIQVVSEDASGDPLPGQEITITWDAGDDFFFTGLKPEIGLGYADFLMEPGLVYQVHMAAGGQSVPDITPAECETESGSRYWGSWLLVFSRP
jgi:hypothetical protein